MRLEKLEHHIVHARRLLLLLEARARSLRRRPMAQKHPQVARLRGQSSRAPSPTPRAKHRRKAHEERRAQARAEGRRRISEEHKRQHRIVVEAEKRRAAGEDKESESALKVAIWRSQQMHGMSTELEATMEEAGMVLVPVALEGEARVSLRWTLRT